MAPPERIHGHRPSEERFSHRSPPAYRPVLFESRYFVSAYARFVASLFVLAGAYTVVALELVEMIPTRAEVFYELQAAAESLPASVRTSDEPLYELPMVRAGDGPFRGYLHVLEWLFSLELLVGTVVVAGVVAVALERTVGS